MTGVPLTQRQFLLGIALVEEKLRAGEYGPELNALLVELQDLARDAVEVDCLLQDDAALADRFDTVVAAAKEVRDETVSPRAEGRCLDCPGATHSTERCPFRWSRS